MAKAKITTEKAAAEVLTPPPRFIRPQIVADKKAIPKGKEWIHEVKHDGWRLQARIEDGKITLTSRGGMDVTKEFTLVAEELSRLPVKNAILDGELTAPRPNGQTFLEDFRLARANNKKWKNQEPFQYYAFDLLYLDGQDLTRTPLIERKKQLKKILRKKPEHATYVMHYISTRKSTPENLIKVGLEAGIEGYVSKLANDIYHPGQSSVTWLKYKFRDETRRKAEL